MRRIRPMFVLILFSVFLVALSGLSEGAECPLSAQQHYWKLDEAAAPYADSAGGGSLTCTDCPDQVNGKVGNAQKFSGTDAAGTAGNLVNWANTDSFSIELWAKLDAGCADTQVFIGRDEPGTGTPLHWWVGCSAGLAKVRISDTNGDSYSIASTTSIADGQWHHIAAVRNAAESRMRFYIDGIQEPSIHTTYLGDFSGSAPVDVGAMGGGYFFRGALDEVSIYRRALSSDEIAAHYNGGSGMSYCDAGPPPEENNPPSAPELVSVVVNADNTVTFTWKPSTDIDPGDGISNYELYFDTDPDYTGCEPVKVDASGQVLAYAGVGGFGAGILLMGLALAGRIRNRRRIFILIGTLLLVSAFLVSCGGGGGSDDNTPPPPPGNELSYQTTAPLASGTYHWKIEAYDQKGASSETEGDPFIVP